MNQDQKDKLADALGIDKDTQQILDIGSSHNSSCRCEICRQWWIAMGPDGDSYGPFTRDEIFKEE